MDTPIQPARSISLQQAPSGVRNILLHDFSRCQHHSHYSYYGSTSHVSPNGHRVPFSRTCKTIPIACRHPSRISRPVLHSRAHLYHNVCYKQSCKPNISGCRFLWAGVLNIFFTRRFFILISMSSKSLII